MRVLLLGANGSHVRSIRALRSAGLEVVAVDDKPVPLGLLAADEGIPLSPTDIDGIELALSGRPKVDAVLHTNEEFLDVAYILRDRFGLEWPPEAAREALRSKVVQRERWAGDPGLSVWSREVGSAEELHDVVQRRERPVIVKPVRSRGGSRGVLQLLPGEDAVHAFREAASASMDGRVMAEEMLVGRQLSCDAILSRGEATVHGVGRNLKQAPPHQVNLAIEYPAPGFDLPGPGSGHSWAGGGEQCAGALGYSDGPVHLEMVETPDGLRPIELAARCGGGVIPDVLAARTGVHPMMEAVMVAGGQSATCVGPSSAGAAVIRYLTPASHGDLDAEFTEVGCDQDKVVDAFAFSPGSGSVSSPSLKSTADRAGHIAVVGDDLDGCWDLIARIGAQMKATCSRPSDT